MLHQNVLEAIGNTPLFHLRQVGEGNVFAKAEFFNPGGSIKDRVAKFIVEQAEKDGELKPGYTIIEATSGNTGIGLALVGVQKGYRVQVVMPENMSEERKKILKAFGAELYLTPACDSLTGCLAKVEELRQKTPESWVARQFTNTNNPQVHYETTGPEIWEDMKGDIDVFVAGVGSGGTLQGVGRFLKEQKPEIRVVAVEPRAASALLGREPGLHQIQGIGDGFVPEVLDVNLVDMVITVTDQDAVDTTRQLALREGLLVGTSSGGNVWAAVEVAGPKRKVVTVLPDRAERYFSTALL